MLATGDEIWTMTLNLSGLATGLSTDGERLFVTTDSGDLVAYDSTDRHEQWRTSLAARDGVTLDSLPLVTDQSVIVTTQKPHLNERATTIAVDRRTGAERWTVEQPGNVTLGSAVAAGDRLYIPLYGRGESPDVA
ncbi:MAG: PQQ-binding-like beta-propeller repeat protein [Halorientalis sp.]